VAEVGQDVVQRLGTGHDQRAVPHDAQVPDDLPQVFAHGGDVECGSSIRAFSIAAMGAA
jgi:hypothetical protein